MAENGTRPPATEARRMLGIFASVDAHAFDATATTSAGDKIWFRRDLPLLELTRTMPKIIDDADRRQHNIIVHPHGSGTTFLQLDDLADDHLAPAAAVAFLVINTSPGNHQAWLALRGYVDKDLARRIRKGTRAARPASPAAVISRTNTRPTIRAWRFAQRGLAVRPAPRSWSSSVWSPHRKSMRRCPCPIRQPASMAELRQGP
jgi:hypothetical protein